MVVNQTLALITSLHVLAHGIFGCCAHHHGAASNVGACSRSEEGSEEAHHSQCPHCSLGFIGSMEGADEALRSENRTPESPHHCIHQNCHWVTSKGQAGADGALLVVHVQDALPRPASALPASASATPALWSHHPFAAALRAHIRLNVLQV
jgi:hypothetical protein